MGVGAACPAAREPRAADRLPRVRVVAHRLCAAGQYLDQSRAPRDRDVTQGSARKPPAPRRTSAAIVLGARGPSSRCGLATRDRATLFRDRCNGTLSGRGPDVAGAGHAAIGLLLCITRIPVAGDKQRCEAGAHTLTMCSRHRIAAFDRDGHVGQGRTMNTKTIACAALRFACSIRLFPFPRQARTRQRAGRQSNSGSNRRSNGPPSDARSSNAMTRSKSATMPAVRAR